MALYEGKVSSADQEDETGSLRISRWLRHPGENVVPRSPQDLVEVEKQRQRGSALARLDPLQMAG